jgi:DNA-binding winged helix-turn-helix (wHTH) protein/TolB-like protein
MDQVARRFPVLGRIDLAAEDDFALGFLAVRPSRREVEGAGVRHVLQRRVMQVLVALARPTAEVVSHDELIRRCWGGLAVTEDAVSRCIGQLRRLAGQWGEPPYEIATIAGVGYRLDAGPAGPDLSAPALPTPGRRRLWMAAGLAAALVLPLVAGLTLWAAGRPSPAASTPGRVAVMPLEAFSTGPDARFLADGVDDEVLGLLSARQLEALPREDTAALRGPNAGREAAKLGVDLLLTGSVQVDGGVARITTRLEDAQSHVTVWSADFQRTAAAEADLRLEVAAKVVDIIEMAQFARTASPPLTDDAALAAELQAHDLLRWDRSRSWAQIIEAARQVTIRAPDFALGHSQLALGNAYAVRWNAAPPQQTPAMVAEARREAKRALALDSGDASAYFALAIVEPDLAAREAILLKGLAANGHPRVPLAAVVSNEGRLLRAVGRLRESLPYTQRSQALDPLSATKVENLVLTYSWLGETGEAEQELERGLTRWPKHPDILDARLNFLAFYGPPGQAFAMLDDRAGRPPSMTPSGIAAWRAFVQARSTPGAAEIASAARAVSRAMEAGALDDATAALMLARLGRLDAAFAAAGAVATQPRANPEFLFSPPAAPIRRDPRFWPLAARFGLVDYWRTTGKRPDFCSGPHPEADCRALAGRASG